MNNRGTKDLKASRLDSITPKFVDDDQLADVPARLFRQLLRKIAKGPHRWTQLLRSYLDWVVTHPDKDKAKSDRTTRLGNIKSTYFEKPTLTFNKLLEGCTILKIKTCVVTITVIDENGEEFQVSESIQINTQARENEVDELDE